MQRRRLRKKRRGGGVVAALESVTHNSAQLKTCKKQEATAADRMCTVKR